MENILFIGVPILEHFTVKHACTYQYLVVTGPQLLLNCLWYDCPQLDKIDTLAHFSHQRRAENACLRQVTPQYKKNACLRQVTPQYKKNACLRQVTPQYKKMPA